MAGTPVYYDWEGQPAMRPDEDDWNVTVTMPGGKTRHVSELAKFMSSATRVPKEHYEKLVEEATAAKA